MNTTLRFGLLCLAALVFVSMPMRSQAKIQAGIFAENNVLEVRGKASGGSISGATFSGFRVTLRWLTSYGVTLSEATTVVSSFSSSPSILRQGGVLTDGEYSYQTYGCTPTGPTITWTQDTEYPLFTVTVTGNSGVGFFEIPVWDEFILWNFIGYYVEVDGSDVTDYMNPSYAYGTNCALPVELTSFSASANRLGSQLAWSTATEKNNYGFDVERRSLGDAAAEWMRVGFVAGSGTKSTPTEYSYAEEGLAPGRYAYRIKQIDNDGTFTYSMTSEIEVGTADKVLSLSDNYPNPFNPSTLIEFSLPSDGYATLKVFNAVGQEVASLFDGEAAAGRIIQGRFDAKALSTGLYFARLQFDGKTLIKKMTLLR